MRSGLFSDPSSNCFNCWRASNGSPAGLIGDTPLAFCDAEFEGLIDAVDVEDVLDELLWSGVLRGTLNEDSDPV